MSFLFRLVSWFKQPSARRRAYRPVVLELEDRRLLAAPVAAPLDPTFALKIAAGKTQFLPPARPLVKVSGIPALTTRGKSHATSGAHSHSTGPATRRENRPRQEQGVRPAGLFEDGGLAGTRHAVEPVHDRFGKGQKSRVRGGADRKVGRIPPGAGPGPVPEAAGQPGDRQADPGRVELLETGQVVGTTASAYPEFPNVLQPAGRRECCLPRCPGPAAPAATLER